jgi:hypothetical protein
MNTMVILDLMIKLAISQMDESRMPEIFQKSKDFDIIKARINCLVSATSRSKLCIHRKHSDHDNTFTDSFATL